MHLHIITPREILSQEACPQELLEVQRTLILKKHAILDNHIWIITPMRLPVLILKILQGICGNQLT